MPRSANEGLCHAKLCSESCQSGALFAKVRVSWIMTVSRIPSKKEAERGGGGWRVGWFSVPSDTSPPAAAPTLSTFMHIWPYSSAGFPKAIFILLLFQHFLEHGHLRLVQEEAQALAQQSPMQGSAVPTPRSTEET